LKREREMKKISVAAILLMSCVLGFSVKATEQFPYCTVFGEDILKITEDVEQIVGIDMVRYSDLIRMAVIRINYSEGLSDEEKIYWQDYVENQLELRWYVKSVVRDAIIVIDGPPPWPGFVIGRLLVVFIDVCDLDGDGMVNIQDITIVAAAFKTKPGYEKWNPLADLAEPYGEINIVDVAMVAKDYGKTVGRSN
jgi:hypothetical protein